jgi:hypothetical protein
VKRYSWTFKRRFDIPAVTAERIAASSQLWPYNLRFKAIVFKLLERLDDLRALVVAHAKSHADDPALAMYGEFVPLPDAASTGA